MVRAVSFASPVNIFTWTPLSNKVDTASRTPGRGGSNKPTMPRKVSCCKSWPSASAKTGNRFHFEKKRLTRYYQHWHNRQQKLCRKTDMPRIGNFLILTFKVERGPNSGWRKWHEAPLFAKTESFGMLWYAITGYTFCGVGWSKGGKVEDCKYTVTSPYRTSQPSGWHGCYGISKQFPVFCTDRNIEALFVIWSALL